MTRAHDLLRQALEFLESAYVSSDLVWKRHDLTVEIREYLDKTKGKEPLCWIHPMDIGIGRFGSVTFNRDSGEQVPLYLHPKGE